MVPSIDIFKSDPDGEVLWIGAVDSLAAAKDRIAQLGESSPGEYLIFDQATGHKVFASTPSCSVETHSLRLDAIGALS